MPMPKPLLDVTLMVALTIVLLFEPELMPIAVPPLTRMLVVIVLPVIVLFVKMLLFEL